MLDLLQTELKQVQLFIDNLKQEQSALTKADIDALLPLSQQKSTLADSLRSLAQQRSELLSRAGLPTDRKGMESWLSQQVPEQGKILQKLWEALLDAGRTAQRLNETNGKLIKIHLQHNQQALNTLAAAAGSASVYGADGQHHTAPLATGRTFGKA